METAPAPHDDRPFRSTPIDRNGITPNRHLPHVLRPRADAHPELCRVDGCTGKVKARGACDQHLTALTRAGDTAILLPRADRAEAAKRSAATRAMGKGEGVASAPVVEQPAPADALEDGDGVKSAPVAPKVLERIGPDHYANIDGPTISVWRSADMPGTWCALDTSRPPITRYPTAEEAAAHLGARLPAPPVSGAEAPDLDTPAATDQPTTRERELQVQVEAQAGQIRRAEQARVVAEANAASLDRAMADITLALDKSGKVNDPEMTGADRVRALVAYVRSVEEEGGHYGRLCSEAHDALDTAGIPPGGQPADRIRILAAHKAGALPSPGIAAELLADLEDVADAGEPWGAHLVRALRLAVGVES